MDLSVVILAAGKGKRMHTAVPKVLHKLGGIPLLERVVTTAQSLAPKEIYVVYGNGGGQVKKAMQHLSVQWIDQHEQLGTGHAVLQALPKIPSDHQVLVLYGDVPLISTSTLKELIHDSSLHALNILVTKRDNPTGYGRIIRDKNGNLIAIIEHKDATEDQRQIKEINTGFLSTRAENLKKWLPKLANHNAQGEYYLTDVVATAVADHCPVVGVVAHSAEETQGVNDRCELAQLERYYQHQAAQQLMLQGVTFLDPKRFDLRGTVASESDVTIDVNVILSGHVSIGQNTVIGPNTQLKNVVLGKDVIIESNCVIEDVKIEDGCRIGPFARIRPGTHLEKNVHVGNFVEIKKSVLGEGTKAAHLSYLGDAIIGKHVNIGAGTITCNYDGVHKHQTIIKDGAFIGSDTQLVAPVTVGEGAYIGAGSTITNDAPPKKLTLSRNKQVTVEKWRPPEKEEKITE